MSFKINKRRRRRETSIEIQIQLKTRSQGQTTISSRILGLIKENKNSMRKQTQERMKKKRGEKTCHPRTP